MNLAIKHLALQLFFYVSLYYFSKNSLCISQNHQWSTALDCLHREWSAQTAAANFAGFVLHTESFSVHRCNIEQWGSITGNGINEC